MPVAVEALLAIEDHQHHLVIKQPEAPVEVVPVVDQLLPQETVPVVLPIPEEVEAVVDMMIPTPMVPAVQAAQV
jgi:hypothetical protein